MAAPTTITTTINIQSAENGTAAITNGTATGAKNRYVTVTAYPNSGYEFVGWTIERNPAELNPVPVGGYTLDVNSMCGTYPQTQYCCTLYYDGTSYFRDRFGVETAPDGYYGAGDISYFQITGGRITAQYTCPPIEPPPVVSTGGGGGGIRVVTDSFGGVTLVEDVSRNFI